MARDNPIWVCFIKFIKSVSFKSLPETQHTWFIHLYFFLLFFTGTQLTEKGWFGTQFTDRRGPTWSIRFVGMSIEIFYPEVSGRVTFARQGEINGQLPVEFRSQPIRTEARDEKLGAEGGFPVPLATRQKHTSVGNVCGKQGH